MSNFDSIDEALDCESKIVREPKEHDLINVSDEDFSAVFEKIHKESTSEFSKKRKRS